MPMYGAVRQCNDFGCDSGTSGPPQVRQPLPQTVSETQKKDTRGRGPVLSLLGMAAKQPLHLPAPVFGVS